jgi:hypothetical protein
VKFDGPLVVGRRLDDLYAAGDQFVMKEPGIIGADPDPCPSASLIASTEIDARVSAGHKGEIVGAPGHPFETERVYVKAAGARHVFNAENECNGFVARHSR